MKFTFRPIPPVQDLYLGCKNEAGHYFHWPQPTLPRASCSELDRHFASYYELDGRFTTKRNLAEGASALHCFHPMAVASDGFTILSFHDYSIDKRPGSHCTFVLHRHPLNFNEALIEAKRLFPRVFDRIKYSVFLEEAFVYEPDRVLTGQDALNIINPAHPEPIERTCHSPDKSKTWKAGNPPIDGARYIAVGQVVMRDSDSTFVVPFAREIYWSIEHKIWLDAHDDLAISPNPEAAITVFHWIELPDRVTQQKS